MDEGGRASLQLADEAMGAGDLDTAIVELSAAVREFTVKGGQSSLAPATGATLRRLGDLAPTTPAIMHGSSCQGDGGKALYNLADGYERQFLAGAISST